MHGGEAYRAAVWIDDDVRAGIETLSDLAPLHQPRALAAIDAAHHDLPGVPAAACFDTAFHASIPPAAATYALPEPWRQRRFGFHGLSHAYAVSRAAELLGAGLEDLRVVSCHLGAGASLAAVAGGRSVDTTMGFTPLEGLVMGTRSGSVDPGLLLWLIEHEGVVPAELADGLEHRSGLLALAGTGDMREILTRADAGDGDACAALDVYVHRLRAGVGAMAAAMNGLDVLVFTGGVGEHAAAGAGGGGCRAVVPRCRARRAQQRGGDVRRRRRASRRDGPHGRRECTRGPPDGAPGARARVSEGGGGGGGGGGASWGRGGGGGGWGRAGGARGGEAHRGGGGPRARCSFWGQEG